MPFYTLYSNITAESTWVLLFTMLKESVAFPIEISRSFLNWINGNIPIIDGMDEEAFDSIISKENLINTVNFGGKSGCQFMNSSEVFQFHKTFSELLLIYRIPKKHLENLFYIMMYYTNDEDLQSTKINKANRQKDAEKFLIKILDYSRSYYDRLATNDKYLQIYDEIERIHMFVRKTYMKKNKLSLDDVPEVISNNPADIIRFYKIPFLKGFNYLPQQTFHFLHSDPMNKSISYMKFPNYLQYDLKESFLSLLQRELKNSELLIELNKDEIQIENLQKIYSQRLKHQYNLHQSWELVVKLLVKYIKENKLLKKPKIPEFVYDYFALFKM